MKTDSDNVSRELLSSFKRLHHQLKQSLFSAINVNLKPSPYMVLVYLLKKENCEGQKGQRISDIASHVGMSIPGVTQIINSLEKDSLVKRFNDPNDGRSSLISISDEGKIIIKPAAEVLQKKFNGLIEHLGKKNSSELLRLIQETEEYFLK